MVSLWTYRGYKSILRWELMRLTENCVTSDKSHGRLWEVRHIRMRECVWHFESSYWMALLTRTLIVAHLYSYVFLTILNNSKLLFEVYPTSRKNYCKNLTMFCHKWYQSPVYTTSRSSSRANEAFRNHYIIISHTKRDVWQSLPFKEP